MVFDVVFIYFSILFYFHVWKCFLLVLVFGKDDNPGVKRAPVGISCPNFLE